MLSSPLLPTISHGLENMPQGEAFALLVRLVSAMIAGVVLSSMGCHLAHPVRRCAYELTKVGLAERVSTHSVEELVQIVEEIGAQIWRLAEFQCDARLKSDLISLVAPVCQPATKII
ncbi:hypothetical protein ACFPOB_26480 [Bosea eneae]|uniref:Uncharacterized protein n=1 Tax=Bosea eneae TaxID=151454 RepID=A0ABW0J1X1_9HYPH